MKKFKAIFLGIALSKIIYLSVENNFENRQYIAISVLLLLVIMLEIAELIQKQYLTEQGDEI
jgi:hypothetical protein